MRLKIAKWLAIDYVQNLEERECTIEQTVNQRVATIVSQMDPFEPFLKKYHGIFSEEFARPEDNLNDQGKILLYGWAYTQVKDPSFRHLTEWIQNMQGNLTLRKAKNDHEWFYGRCAVIVVELLVKEVRRLAVNYEGLMVRKDKPFDDSLSVE